MWANTAPDGGLIACGISDDGTIEGCKASPEHLNKLDKVSYTFCPDAASETRRVPVQNKVGEPDFVILFRVKYHPNLVVKTTAGKVLVRKGDSKTELRPDEIRELQADKGEISLSRMRAEWPGLRRKASAFVPREKSCVEFPSCLPPPRFWYCAALGGASPASCGRTTLA